MSTATVTPAKKDHPRPRPKIPAGFMLTPTLGDTRDAGQAFKVFFRMERFNATATDPDCIIVGDNRDGTWSWSVTGNEHQRQVRGRTATRRHALTDAARAYATFLHNQQTRPTVNPR